MHFGFVNDFDRAYSELSLNTNIATTDTIGLNMFPNDIGEIITPLNVWSYITLCYQINGDNNYTLKAYRDGVKKLETNVTSALIIPPDGNQKPGFGRIYTLTATAKEHRKHFSIFDRILSDQEILDLYQNGGVPQGF